MSWFGFGKKDTREAITKGPWEVYGYTYGEGERAMITVDVPAATEPAHRGHPHCRRVILFSPVEQVFSNGLPQRAELARLNQAEDTLVTELGARGVDCRKVGHMLYRGMRDIVFQCEDPAAFEAAFHAWKGKVNGGQVELVAREGGWSFFDEKLRPKLENWAWIENSRVVRGLVEAGTNFQAIHRLDHFFVGPPASLKEVETVLRERGLSELSPSSSGLTLRQDLALDVDLITTWTQRFGTLAAAAGARYDGWGAPVIRP